MDPLHPDPGAAGLRAAPRGAGASPRGRSRSRPGGRSGTALALFLAACAPPAQPSASPPGPPAHAGAAADSGAASRTTPPASAPATIPVDPAPGPAGAGAPSILTPALGPPGAAQAAIPAATRAPPPSSSAPGGEPPPASGGASSALPALPVARAEARASEGSSALRVERITPIARDSIFEVAVSVRAPEARLQLLDARDAVVPSSGSTVVAEETRFSLAPDEPLRPGAEYSLRLEGLRASAVTTADGRTFQPLALRLRVVGATPPSPARRKPRGAPSAGLPPAVP
jgi:hypothetical protein